MLVNTIKFLNAQVVIFNSWKQQLVPKCQILSCKLGKGGGGWVGYAKQSLSTSSDGNLVI